MSWKGKHVIIRIPGGYHYIGRCIHVDAMRIVLVDACWLASGGGQRWADMLRDGPDEGPEIEPYPDGHQVDLPYATAEVATWGHALPRRQQ